MTHLIIWGAVLISIFKWILKRSRLNFAIRISTAQNVIRILICYIAKRFFVCFFSFRRKKKQKRSRKQKKIYKKIIEDSAWKMKGHTDTKPNTRDSFFFFFSFSASSASLVESGHFCTTQKDGKGEKWLFPYFGHAFIWNTEYWFLVFIQKYWTEFKRLSNHVGVFAALMHSNNGHITTWRHEDMKTWTLHIQWTPNDLATFFVFIFWHFLQRNFNN